MAGFVQFVTITTKQGAAPALLKHLKAITAEVAANEPGTVKYYSAQSQEDENKVYLWEQYDSDEALAKHREGTAYKAFAAAREEIFGSAIKLERLTPL
ncbi:hypothetical protein IAR55_006735 [Kwoniella newhampshirensis]|uniref:ABM domain-containing protein n=1 Tax=Kwoniella newhampshirensis TaxID=1651941 RepID=A0AAW0YDV9_9TREE